MATGAAGGFVFLAAADLRAGCPLRLVSEGAPPEWVAAARASADRLAPVASHDCGRVEITVGPGGAALLTFFTTDGRRAVRELMSPSELDPAVDALLVTLPPEPSPVPAPPAKPLPSPAPPAAAPTDAPVVRAEAPSQRRFLVGGALGARMGVAGVFVAPAATLRPSGVFGHWELSAAAEVDPLYSYVPGGLPAGFGLWSLVVGAQVGRREELGGLALGYGVGLGVADVHEKADDSAGVSRSIAFAQPRASAYLRVVTPRRTRVRGLFELGVDAALADFDEKATTAKDLPTIPRWGLLASVGVEASVL